MSLWKLCSGEEFSPDLVRAALERGEDVNQRGPNNWSLLMFAAAKNKIPLLRLMLEQPLIELNPVCDEGTTALQYAALRGHGEALKLLLEHPSISVNLSCASTGFTALHMAAFGFQGRGETVKLLLADPRVDVNCKDRNGNTPLILAARNEDNFDALKLLLADQRVDVNCEGSLTALRSAIEVQNIKAVKLLLDNDRVDVNGMDSDGYNALFIAFGLVTSKDARVLELLELFLSHPRVDLNCKAHGTTLLHYAVLKNNVEAVRMLLAETRFILHNALEEKEGTSAVGLAAMGGHWDILKELAHHPKVDLAVSGLDPDDLMRYEVCTIIRTF